MTNELFPYDRITKRLLHPLNGSVEKNLKVLPVTAAVKSDPQESNVYCWSGKDSIALGTGELYKTKQTKNYFLHFLIIPNSQNNMMYLNSTSVLNGAFLSLIIALNQSSFLFCCFRLKDKLIKYFGTNQRHKQKICQSFQLY